MKKIFAFLAISGLVLLATSVGTYADLAKPSTSPAKPLGTMAKPVIWSGLTIEADPKAYEARLQISQSALKELRAALTDQPGNQSGAASTGSSSPRTILAGLSLFLAISVGGIWLVRSGPSRGQKAAAAVLIGMAIIGAATVITQANAGPPGSYRWRTLTRNLNEGRATSGTVAVEIVNDGEGMKLILPITPTKKTSDE